LGSLGADTRRDVSYDLFFKPRSGEVQAESFADYFNQRPYYKLTPPQAWYENEDTGVYFVFEHQSEAEDDENPFFPLALNINYYRPSFFGLEAEPEVSAFVKAFDLTVSDPQNDGMGEGEYDRDLFLRGWGRGNEFAYSAILREPANRKDVVCLPTAKLLKTWAWNRDRDQLQKQLGESTFVPRALFVLLSGKPATAAVWPDGIPIAVPEVDYFLVPRKELAPRRFLKRVEDRTLLSWADAKPVFEKHRSTGPRGTLVLNYYTPPADIERFVQSLPIDDREIQGLAADKVLNQEVVERSIR
jgi:hypothetical protein